ncbi:MAG TPA: hypothetical protein VGH90_07260, partial [Chthoniobacteraceae bacterium]
MIVGLAGVRQLVGEDLRGAFGRAPFAELSDDGGELTLKRFATRGVHEQKMKVVGNRAGPGVILEEFTNDL